METVTQNTPVRRRTQAERSATTRTAVINAAAYCISEKGFANTTTGHIARRAGVTWGAIQHQFGDKDAILFALIERSLDEMAAVVRGAVGDSDDLRERTRHFVTGMWRVYQTPAFRAGLEILLGSRGAKNSDSGLQTRRFIQVLVGLFNETFSEFDISPERLFEAMRFSLATLAGFALEETFNGSGGNFDGPLDTLSETLLTILEAPTA
jgi:AcrR family transcriptional regulator